MTTPLHTYRNTLTGKLDRLSEDAASVFPEYLERVPDDAKPFEPGLFKPGKVGEFANPEPLTDEQTVVADQLAEVLEEHSPNTKVAKEAKAEKVAVDEKVAAEQAAIEKEQK